MADNSLLEIKNMLLEELKKIYPSAIVSLWFEPLKIVSIEGTTIIVSITQFKKSFVETQYYEIIRLKLSEIIGVDIDLQLISDEEEAALLPEVSEEPISLYHTRFDPSYTFENFIVGKTNQLAQSAAVAVSHNLAEYYNPLFLYGPSGLGKTHLLFAIMNEIREQDRKAREIGKEGHRDHNILYVSGEEFTIEMIESLTKKSSVMFRDKYRNVDVLLVDDVQFIAGKLGVQEEFFHTFDTLFRMKKQIILASDRPPKDINNLEDRLKTRFEMGLVADIQPPDLELRVSIFQRKAMDYDIFLDSEVLFYLAENITTNIRQIEGALKKLRAHSLITGVKIDKNVASEVLNEYFKSARSDDAVIDRIFEYTEKRYGVKRDEIKSPRRNAEIIAARHYATYLIRKVTNLSQKTIAGIFHKKDHTTVINSIAFIEDKMRREPAFEREIISLIAELKG